MKLLQYLLKKDMRSKKDIFKQAMNSSNLDYHVLETPKETHSEISFNKAVSHIPNMVFDLQEVDYYA